MIESYASGGRVEGLLRRHPRPPAETLRADAGRPGACHHPAMSEPLTFDRYLALPRLSGLRLAPDGGRLVVSVDRPAPDGKAFRSALWQVDPAGVAPARRITRSSVGESHGAFVADGSLLFTSARPDPDARPDGPKGDRQDDRKIAALWQLPADGGEARLLVAPDNGADGLAAARSAPVFAFGAALHPAAGDLEADAAIEKARHDAGVSAILFEEYPIRHWDHWLGPRHRRLFAATLPADPEARPAPRDLTGEAGGAFVESAFDLSPDGATLVTIRRDPRDLPLITADLVAIDTASGAERPLTHGDAWYAEPRVSPDGRWVACLRTTFGSSDEASVQRLWLVELATGRGRLLAASLDLWPESLAWAPDSGACFFTADRDGRVAAFRVDLADDRVTRLVAEGAVADLCPAPDGRTVYALWATMATPPRIVRFATDRADQVPEVLPNGVPEGGIAANGVVERLEATAADGTRIGSWLVRPAGASAERPAPLVVFAHGGPIGSWNGWHWRWNPHLLVERGYAVLLPDPAISTGYGQAMIERGWGRWGETPFTDILAATDAALERPDLDRARTALMGGSYGGYMANWVAGQTDRFLAIVTHASLWELRGFHGTTDTGAEWEFEMGDPYRRPELYLRQSPFEHLAQIRTPMLVIHGEQDFRVPVSEALRLWTDLRRHGVPARFLYFPDENHWILKPQNARLWYETVLAFLDEHVLELPRQRAALA